jgi:hypothetical protein
VDPNESNDVAEAHPEVVERMKRFMEQAHRPPSTR